jgi:hypothetical protein
VEMPSSGRPGRRGVCPYANFAATGLEAGDKLGRTETKSPSFLRGVL